MSGNPAQARGNVIFIILIAIALLAALTYSVVRSNRNSASLSREDAIMAANDILNYADTVENGVAILMSGGTTAEKLSFENGEVAGYANAGAAAANELFNPSGGGVTYRAPRPVWLDSTWSAKALYAQWYFPANTCLPLAGRGGSTCDSDGDDNEELLMILPYIKLEVCLELNRKIDIEECAADDPCDDNSELWPGADTKFTGSFSDGEALWPAAGSQYEHKTAGCFEGSGTAGQPAASYHFYKLLAAR